MQYTCICAIIYASLCPVIFEYSTLKSRPVSCKILKIEKALIVQGGSNVTGTQCGLFTHKSVAVIFEPPCKMC